jgi:hypothetical protein
MTGFTGMTYFRVHFETSESTRVGYISSLCSANKVAVRERAAGSPPYFSKNLLKGRHFGPVDQRNLHRASGESPTRVGGAIDRSLCKREAVGSKAPFAQAGAQNAPESTLTQNAKAARS